MMNEGYGMFGGMGIGALLVVLIILLLGFGVGYAVGRSR